MTANTYELANKSRHEKGQVALSSVVAAVFLTGMKRMVGLLAGSLGILSEAVHSGPDLGHVVIHVEPV